MIPNLAVHPVHLQQGIISSITWCRKATSNGTNSNKDAGEVPWVVWSAQSRLKLMTSSAQEQSCIEVDLMLANVKQDLDSDSGENVIIVNPWCDPQHTTQRFGDIDCESLKSRADMAATSCKALSAPNECKDGDDDTAAHEFWIFVVEGNDSAVRAILGRMGQAGAIRWNPFAVLEVGRKIGSGAHAQVYRAEHCHAYDVTHDGCKNRLVLKVLNPIPTFNTASEELGAIQHEITLMVLAGRHPNIVKFLGVFCLEGEGNSVNVDVNTVPSICSPSVLNPRWALVGEYLQGGDVFDAVHKRTFKEPCAKQVTADLLCALSHIHRHGIVHRDVKVENLLLAKDGMAVLTDFGVAALISDDEAMRKQCGSPGYAAPEIISQERYGIKVDSFSAGATLYFMLCGRLPFEGNTPRAVLKRTIKKEVSFENHPQFSKVSVQCKHFILELLQKDPNNRPTAEQAVSQMWCCSDEMESGQHTWSARSSSAVSGRPFMDTNTFSSVPEARFCDQHHDSQASSSSRSRFLQREVEREHPKEDDLDNGQGKDSTRDSFGQRGSFRGWSQRVNRLMSKLRTSKADSQAMHDSSMEIQKGRSEKSEFTTFKKNASHGEACAGENSVNPAIDKHDSLAHLSSETSGGLNPHMMRCQNGRLLQPLTSAKATKPPLLQPLTSAKATKPPLSQIEAQSSQLASGITVNVVPPAIPPEHPRPHTKSLWGRLSQGINRKEEDSRKEVDDGTNQSERGASSFSQGPIMKDEGQESMFHPIVEATQPNPPNVLLSAGVPRGRYRNRVKVRESSSSCP